MLRKVKNSLFVINYDRISSARISWVAIRKQSSLNVTANVQEESQNNLNQATDTSQIEEPEMPKRQESQRIAEFRKKLKEDMVNAELDKYNLMSPVENDPLPPWPENVNPHTGEVGGPRGPEPTRYGDWERKGICVDF